MKKLKKSIFIFYKINYININIFIKYKKTKIYYFKISISKNLHIIYKICIKDY